MRLGRFYSLIEKFIGDRFATYGAFVARHAWKVIIGSVIMNALFALGMLRFKLQTDAFKIFPPTGNKAEENVKIIDSIFPESYHDNYFTFQNTRINTWACVIVRSQSGNLLDRSQLSQMAQIDADLHAMIVTRDDGSTFQLQNVCAKNNDSCHVDGSVFFHPKFMAAMENNAVPYPLFKYTDSQIVDLSFLVGGKVERNAFGFLTSVEYIRLAYNLIPTNDNAEDKLAWVHSFQRKMERFQSPDLDIAYSHYMSSGEELWVNIHGDTPLIAATASALLIYSVLCCISYKVSNQVGQRAMLAVGGVLATCLGIGSGFGLSALVGVEFIPVLGVVPCLVLGIGLDDMFLLLSGIAGAQGLASVEEKMATTLRVSGVGITITSVTDLVAFLTGISSPFPVVRNFSIYTASSILFCYINHVTMFAACIALNERRVAENRHFFTFRKVQSRSEAEHSGKSVMATFCCSGWAPTSRADVEGAIDKFIRFVFPKVVLNNQAKTCICIGFTGYIAASIYGCAKVKTGMDFTQITRKDSYNYRYMKWLEDVMPNKLIVQFVLPDKHEYSRETTQTALDQLLISIQTEKTYDSSWDVSWLKSYKMSSFYTNISEAAFITNLQSFLRLPLASSFRNDIVFDANRTSILASRFYVRSTKLTSLTAKRNFLTTTRDLENLFPMHCFGHQPWFIAVEADAIILRQTLIFIGIALINIIVITSVFMPHPIPIVLITLSVTSITVGVFGFLFYIDVTLSYITMIELIMSIGLSVDFTAHICHGYMISKDSSRDKRVKHSFDKAGAPIFHGAVSTILAALVLLIFGNSYLFRTFAAVWSFIILFGIAHALLLLPVVLSWIGPTVAIEDRNINVNIEFYPKDANTLTLGNLNKSTEETKIYNERMSNPNYTDAAFQICGKCSTFPGNTGTWQRLK